MKPTRTSLNYFQYLPPEIITVKIIPNLNIQALHALSKTCTYLASMTKDFRYRLKSLMPILENTDNSIEYLVNSAYKKYLKKEDDLFTELKLKKLWILQNEISKCSQKFSVHYQPVFKKIESFLEKLNNYPFDREKMLSLDLSRQINCYKILENLDLNDFFKDHQNVEINSGDQLEELIESWFSKKMRRTQKNQGLLNLSSISLINDEYESTFFPELDRKMNSIVGSP